MKQIICYLLFVAVTNSAICQVAIPIDSIFNFIKRNSIHSKNADWIKIGNGFKTKLATAKSDVDSIKALGFVFEQLQDYHSSIMYKGNYVSNYPAFDDSTLQYLIPLVQLSQQRTGVFTAHSIGENYVYLQVPGIQASGNDVSVFAQKLSDTLCNYLTSKTKGIIIDLRLNGGGQYSSMAAGLAPLLGDIYLGGGINNELKQTMFFQLKKGNVFLNNHQITSIKHKTNRSWPSLPVAILIGPNTRSSGSILALSFKGRPNTIFIGEATANGYTTGNDFFTFGESVFLNLSTSNSIDRNNKMYKESVEPDILCKGKDDFIVIENDQKVQKALAWLSNLSRK